MGRFDVTHSCWRELIYDCVELIGGVDPWDDAAADLFTDGDEWTCSCGVKAVWTGGHCWAFDRKVVE